MTKYFFYIFSNATRLNENFFRKSDVSRNFDLLRPAGPLKELKSFPWKDVDEKWFSDLINKKEENILENVHRSNSTSSKCETSLHVITEDEVDNRESSGEHDNDDDNELDETVIYDDTIPW